jgi:hypothetical protein
MTFTSAMFWHGERSDHVNSAIPLGAISNKPFTLNENLGKGLKSYLPFDVLHECLSV